ncbi:rCG44787 [Rattus norvegicus]|uniref:RCG44787 n=1 Tax=Rattus norvegicus TaxID=10116 RepID=A6I549_RAT|nr:rCG44787 [Rattus norvegicus]
MCVRGQPSPCTEFQNSQSYIVRPPLEKTKQNKTKNQPTRKVRNQRGTSLVKRSGCRY